MLPTATNGRAEIETEIEIRYARMHSTRRRLLKTAIAGAAGILGAPALRLSVAQQIAHEIPGNVKLADDLYVVRVPGEAAVVAQLEAAGGACGPGRSDGAHRDDQARPAGAVSLEPGQRS